MSTIEQRIIDYLDSVLCGDARLEWGVKGSVNISLSELVKLVEAVRYD
ncbi:MAG: hypothetical protein WC307_06865 [Candidatus Nanoarchaeia archaeon]|jgi:hypothetical protein